VLKGNHLDASLSREEELVEEDHHVLETRKVALLALVTNS